LGWVRAAEPGKLRSSAMTVNAMPTPRISTAPLAALIGISCAAFYIVVAFAPNWLAGQIAGIPLSVLIAVALFLLFFAVTLLYTLSALAIGERP